MEETQVMHLKDIIKFFGYSEKKTRDLIRTGVLPVIKIGKDYVTTRKQLLDWLDKYKGHTVRL